MKNDHGTVFNLNLAKVLIVDDMKTNIVIATHYLKEVGIQVFSTTNPSQVPELIKTQNIDLVLSDIEMPEMTGYELCKLCRENEITKNTPFIFMTSLDRDEDIQKGFEVGGADYIIKPIKPKELLSRTTNILKQKFYYDQAQNYSRIIEKNLKNQNEMTRMLVHDINNLLTTILGSFSIINKRFSDKINDPIFSKYINNGMRSANGIIEIISLVRKIKAVEDNKEQFSLEKVSLTESLTSISESFEESLRKKEIEVEFTGLSDDLFILADKVALKNTIINNIVSNAIKFSPVKSKIEIAVEKKPTSIEVRFKDHGIGMSQELINNIFNVNIPTTREGTSGEQGTGFGMPLMKAYLDKFQSTVKIESITKDEMPDKCGTQFILNFVKV